MWSIWYSNEILYHTFKEIIPEHLLLFHNDYKKEFLRKLSPSKCFFQQINNIWKNVTPHSEEYLINHSIFNMVFHLERWSNSCLSLYQKAYRV